MITLEDRDKIERAYLENADPVEIADTIGAAPSSIYRELARGHTGKADKNGRPAYSAAAAQKAVTENLSRRGRRYNR